MSTNKDQGINTRKGAGIRVQGFGGEGPDFLSQTPDPWSAALEQMLRLQLESQRQLLNCVQRKREAIRTADMQAISVLCAEENSIIQRMAKVEQQRLDLMARWSKVLDPNAVQPLLLRDLLGEAGPSANGHRPSANPTADSRQLTAMILPEPQRSRLQALAAQLREVLHETQQQSSIVRAAAETLSRHMSGIVQTVQGALSRARVYGHRGRVLAGAAINGGIDIRT